MTFKLNSHCHIIYEQNKSCIYDLLNGSMIAINEENTKILKKYLNQNIRMENNFDNKKLSFFSELENLSICAMYEENSYIEKINMTSSDFMEKSVPSNFSFESLYMDISTRCNLNCNFCNVKSYKTLRKTGCKRWPYKKTIMTINDWKKVMVEAENLNCKNLIFIGGEPLIEKKALENLIEFSMKLNFEKRVIHTNGVLINENFILFAKKKQLIFNIQVFSIKDATNYYITGEKTLWEKIYNNIKKLQKENIAFFVTILISKYNEADITETIDFFYKKNINFYIQYIHPILGENHASDNFLDDIYNKKNKFIQVNFKNFFENHEKNNCLGRILAIDSSADIYPCIMMRDIVVGNAINDLLVDVLKTTKFKKLSKITRDKIDACKKCEFRYGCFDCRALENSYTENLYSNEYCYETRKCF